MTIGERGNGAQALDGGDEFGEFGLGEVVAGLDGGLAGHHVERFVQRRFRIISKAVVLGLVQQLSHEYRRIHAALKQQRGERVHRNAGRADRFRLNADALQHRLQLFKQFDLGSIDLDGDGHEQALRFKVGLADALDELLEHDAFMQRMLIDDDHALFILRDQVA